MMKTKNKTRKYRSPLSAAIHESAQDLRRIGLIDEATMRDLDESCLAPPRAVTHDMPR
jgi:putative transcriptional regulator